MIEDRHFFAAMEQEAKRARAKFPQQSFWRTLAALTEEVGELNQAILEHKDFEDIYREAVQTAVMAMRVVIDCGLSTDFEAVEEAPPLGDEDLRAPGDER
jgi:NTP pyrophosphatase (non-canonical NTP hydrolase)